MKFDALLLQVRTSYLQYDIRGSEPQLGQYYMAEFAQKKGYVVRIKRFASNSPIISELRQIINNSTPNIIGAYIDSENIWTIRRLFSLLKEENPNISFVIGGPQVTGNPQKAMDLIPAADFGIVGEGENSIVELLDSIYNNHKIIPSEVCNLVYRCEDTNKIRYSPNYKIEKDLDNFPFPRREEYDIDNNSRFDQILTGRGCIGRCAFCFEGSKRSNPLRFRSIESIIEEIDYLIATYPEQKYLAFLDDTFIIDKNRVTAICNHLIDNHSNKVGWFCEARADILKNNLELLPLLYQAGCIRLQLGGESGSQNVLNSYNKGVVKDDLRTVIRAIHESGIPSVYVNFIIGGAFETIQTFKETLAFAKELIDIAPGTVEVGASIFSPYVGTPITNEPEKYGLTISDYNLITGPDGFMPFAHSDELNEPAILYLYNMFEYEIRKHIKSHLVRLKNNEINKHYMIYQKYELSTLWREYSQEIESYKNYFESIIHNGFASWNNIKSFSDYFLIPYRTCQPLSDGKIFLKNTASGPKPFQSDLEEKIYLLSTGKLTLLEIVTVLKNSNIIASGDEERVYAIYKLLDAEKLVVWRDSM